MNATSKARLGDSETRRRGEGASLDPVASGVVPEGPRGAMERAGRLPEWEWALTARDCEDAAPECALAARDCEGAAPKCSLAARDCEGAAPECSRPKRAEKVRVGWSPLFEEVRRHIRCLAQRLPSGWRLRSGRGRAFFGACFPPVAIAGLHRRSPSRARGGAGMTFPHRRWR